MCFKSSSKALSTHHTNFNLRMNFNVNLRRCLVRLSRIQFTKRRLLLHHMLLINLLIILCHILWSIMNARAIDVALFDLLTKLIRRLWRAVVHRHLLESFRIVICVEERLLGWQIKFDRSHCSLSLPLLTRKSSATRCRLVLRFHYLICWRYITVVVTSSPGLLEITKINLRS